VTLDHPHVVVLCTGNAARSVMVGQLLIAPTVGVRPSIHVSTAGTHAIEGRPVSSRTRAALEALGLSAPGHRSHQLVDDDLVDAAVVVAMEGDHVRYVRRRHPGAAARTATLRRLCRDLPGGGSPLVERVAALDLASVDPEPWEDVADPAGHDEETFVACARELDVLVTSLAPRLG